MKNTFYFYLKMNELFGQPNTTYQPALYGVKMNYKGAIAPPGSHDIYNLKKIDLKKNYWFLFEDKIIFVYWP